MMKTLLTVLALALAGAWPAPLAAQEEETPGLKLRGLSFQTTHPLKEVYAHDSSAEPGTPGVKIQVKDYLNFEYSALPVKGDSLVFTDKPERESIRDPAHLIASARIPARLASAIFMFLPGSGKPGEPPCQVLVIEDHPSRFPAGSLKILNLSPLSVRIELEKQNFDFRSGEEKIISDPPVGKNNSSGMVAFKHEQGQWRRISAGIWPHPGRKRVLQVLFLNPASGQIEMKGMRDISTSDSG